MLVIQNDVNELLITPNTVERDEMMLIADHESTEVPSDITAGYYYSPPCKHMTSPSIIRPVESSGPFPKLSGRIRRSVRTDDYIWAS